MGRLLLNLTICQVLLIVIGIFLNYALCHEQKRQNVTEYDRSFQKVLSRKRRFLVWRAGSNVLITASLVKPLAFKKPTGHALIIEWDIFYPLPTSWKIQKRLTTHKLVPIVATTEMSKPLRSRRIDNFKNRNWNEFNSFDSFQKPPQPLSYKWNPMMYKNQQRSNNFNEAFSRRAIPSYPQQNPRILISNDQHTRFGRSIIDPHESDADEDWEHYRAHRDRRDLYERIQAASPLNSDFIRSCLLRMMCEAQYFLYPKGYSLLHDVLRAVFTIPLKETSKDEYSDAMRVDSGSDCYNIYKDKCPISILGFLLHLKS